MELKDFAMHSFDGTYYSEWRYRIMTFLAAKDLDGVIDGTIPTTDASFRPKDKKVQSILSATIANKYLRLVRGKTTSKEMLDTMDKIYGSKSYMGKGNLYQELLSTRIRSNELASDYIYRFSVLVEELMASGFDSFVAYQVNLFAHGQEIEAHTLETIFTVLLQHEQRDQKHASSSETALTATRGGRQQQKQAGRQNFNSAAEPVTCSYCKKRNHTEDVCRKKIADSKSKNAASQESTRRLRFKDTDDATYANTRRNQKSTKKPSSAPTQGVSMIATPDIILNASEALEASNEWVIDSGASDHFCNNSSWFTNLEPSTGVVRAANGGDMAIEGCGSIHLEMNTPSGIVEVELQNVSYMPSLQYNLFSLSRVSQHGFTTEFSKDTCLIKRGKDILAQGVRKRTLYYLDIANPIVSTVALTTDHSADQSNDMAFSLLASSPADLWHARLGHISVKYTEKTRRYVDGIDLDKCKHEFCASCLAGKQSKLPFPQRSLAVTTAPFELVHSDICGPMPHPALCSRAKYFISFTDDFTRFGFVFLLLQKSDAFKCFTELMAHCNTQYNDTIRCLRSDNGGEYMSAEFTQ
ncbi:hypothetical protein Ae201684P_018185 [Aphanomyces euteiches]|nr:hypothetical protein Ae201684P_018185 [Aphanomyces euteiches]